VKNYQIPSSSCLSFYPGFRIARNGPGTHKKEGSGPRCRSPGRSNQLIKEVYGGEYAKAKTSTEKASVAKKATGKANDSKDDPASQFVLLRLARDVATQAGDGRWRLSS